MRAVESYQAVAGCTDAAVAVNPDPTAHLNLVKRVASHFRSRLPAAIEINDLIQAGIVGLIEALSSFDAERGNDFETFAKLRIRGAMLDEIRRASWAPRSTVKVAVQARQAEARLANETGVAPTHRQIAAELGMDVDRYHKLRGRNQGLAESTTLEDVEFASDDASPEERVDEQQVVARIREGIAALNEREKLVVALYYDEELTLKEIGAVLDVSESRVSQILTAIAGKLRTNMKVDRKT
ncbi:MAG: Sigma-F factor [Pseudomonadota bacterium]|jgi:RNA polymerase sigma factor for flagellar operon FliA|nr:FliA/WhiG family RNA polymerase sigma factor [Gammaproteobacteria bacterium]